MIHRWSLTIETPHRLGYPHLCETTWFHGIENGCCTIKDEVTCPKCIEILKKRDEDEKKYPKETHLH